MTDLPAHTAITTARLRLVPWAQDHAKALNAINNEPEVMEFLSDGTPQTLATTRDAIKRVRDGWAQLGYSWWVIVLRDTNAVIGAACLQHAAHVPGAELEIGWRLTKSATGRGYATEAGLAAARYAFDVVGMDHVIAVADPANTASHRVMQRIGMTYRGVETFYDSPCTTYVLDKTALQ